MNTPTAAQLLGQAESILSEIKAASASSSNKKATHLIHELDDAINKLQSYSKEFEIGFHNFTVTILFARTAKYFTLLLFDIKELLNRKTAKEISHFSSGVIQSTFQVHSRRSAEQDAAANP